MTGSKNYLSIISISNLIRFLKLVTNENTALNISTYLNGATGMSRYFNWSGPPSATAPRTWYGSRLNNRNENSLFMLLFPITDPSLSQRRTRERNHERWKDIMVMVGSSASRYYCRHWAAPSLQQTLLPSRQNVCHDVLFSWVVPGPSGGEVLRLVCSGKELKVHLVGI